MANLDKRDKYAPAKVARLAYDRLRADLRKHGEIGRGPRTKVSYRQRK